MQPNLFHKEIIRKNNNKKLERMTRKVFNIIKAQHYKKLYSLRSQFLEQNLQMQPKVFLRYFLFKISQKYKVKILQTIKIL
jgi:hypothetical protein